MVFSNVEERRKRHYRKSSSNRSLENSESFEEAHLLVHPGYSELNFNDHPEDSIFKWLNETRGARRTDYDSRQVYEGYKNGIQDLLVENQSPVILLYNQGSLDRYTEFFETSIDYPFDKIDLLIDSEPDRGFITDSGIEEFASFLEKIENHGTVYIHGEQNGICPDDSEESLDKVKEILDKDITVEKGRLFPSSPLSI